MNKNIKRRFIVFIKRNSVYRNNKYKLLSIIKYN